MMSIIFPSRSLNNNYYCKSNIGLTYDSSQSCGPIIYSEGWPLIGCIIVLSTDSDAILLERDGGWGGSRRQAAKITVNAWEKIKVQWPVSRD